VWSLPEVPFGPYRFHSTGSSFTAGGHETPAHWYGRFEDYSRGNTYIYVIVVIATKLTFLYPCSDIDSESAARALTKFFATYGCFTEIYTDPGADFTSGLVARLTQIFGVRHEFSLVDRHQSVAVEGTNKKVITYLQALCADDRLSESWSSDEVLPLAAYIINDSDFDECSIPPFQLTFGSEDALFFAYPTLSFLNTKTQFTCSVLMRIWQPCGKLLGPTRPNFARTVVLSSPIPQLRICSRLEILCCSSGQHDRCSYRRPTLGFALLGCRLVCCAGLSQL